MNVEIRNEARSFISWNIYFEFSVQWWEGKDFMVVGVTVHVLVTVELASSVYTQQSSDPFKSEEQRRFPLMYSMTWGNKDFKFMSKPLWDSIVEFFFWRV